MFRTSFRYTLPLLAKQFTSATVSSVPMSSSSPSRIRQRSAESIVDVDAPPKPANSASPEAASKAKKLAPIFLKKAPAPAGEGAVATPEVDVNLSQYLTEPEWASALSAVFQQPFVKNIEKTIAADTKAGIQVFPPRHLIFSALNVCPLSKVKVVIIGQDPYHDVNQAHGMCFSVLPGVKTPPSLVNMYKELATDIPGFVAPKHGYLMSWAKQGALLLNATLTVQAHKANSHEKIGWQDFTDRVIDVVNKRDEPAVFLLWGNFAKKKAQRVNRAKHKVIECAHPSPLSAAKWWGCKTFSKCNDALVDLKKEPINWCLPAQAVVE